MLFPASSAIHLDFRLRSSDPPLDLCNSLQVHLLELPKYAPPSDNRVITDPIEKWVYFFQRAESLTPLQLVDRLGDEAFAEAAGVLEMIARNPKERDLYEARLKLQRDEQSRIEAAKDQGRAEGLKKGRTIGRVQLFQNLLEIPESSAEELESLSLSELSTIENDLQQQLRERGN